MLNNGPAPKLNRSLWCIFYWSLILIAAISFDEWLKSELVAGGVQYENTQLRGSRSREASTRINAVDQAVLTGDVSGCLLTVYVSTNDSVQGTSIGSHSWGQEGNNMHFSCALTPGVKNYLHILVQPPANSRVFFGYFTVSGGAKFASTGSTILDSRPESWQVSLNGWGTGYRTPAVAPNSKTYTSQDPTLDQEDPNAQTLMDPVAGVGGQQNVYFSTVINPGDKGSVNPPSQ